ncbi:hypothetical protein [Ruegeria hyattellae]|uniref:hypothetical protein n=1 Tax=Ruegeria hyattellae TaxID=3233337 RepID=UPI00355B4E74
MTYHTRAADAAKNVLHTAAQRLMTADPTSDRQVARALDRSLDWSLGDPSLGAQAARSFEPSFSETQSRALAFQVTPTGRSISAGDQREMTNDTVRSMIYSHFGHDPLRWYDQRSEPARARYGVSASGGAHYALGVDGSGLREVQAAFEWGPQTLELLPAPVMALAQTALTALPGLRPFATVIRTSAMSGGQQVSFDIPGETSLEAFKPLMEALGMGLRHGGFQTLLAFVLGARFSLPERAATLTLLNTPKGPEMRVDVNIDALPDTPEQLLPLLRLPLTERPQNLSALDSWMTAMTPDGYYGPGSVTVLSVRVRAEMPARLALFLRPIAMETAPATVPEAPSPVPAPPPPGNGAPVAAQAGWPQPRLN